MKRVILAVLCMVVLGGFGFSLDSKDLEKLDKAEKQAKDMLDSLLKVLPNAATQQNIQPKAWIGYLIQVPYPEITQKSGKVKRELPHLTFGPSFGVGIMSVDELNDIGKTLDPTGDDLLPLPLLPWPSVAVDGRIGGIKIPPVDLPFDLGFSFLTLDLSSSLGDDLGLTWMNWGVDARYLVLRQNGFIPDVSAGVGFAHWSLTLNTDYVDAELSSNTLYFTGQASYTLNFFIPYLGLKFMTGKNKAELTVTVEEAAAAVGYGYDNWRTVGSEKSPFQMQVFGGFGLDWLVFQTAIGASIDVTTGTPGLNFSTRFSL